MPTLRSTDRDYGAAVDPPYLYPDYVGTRLRAPNQPLVVLPHTLTELTGAGVRRVGVRGADADLTRQHAGEPLGERVVVAGRVLGADGRPLAAPAGRDLAGERRRPLPARRRRARRAARPELLGRRPRAHRRRRPLPLRHDQAGRVPVGEPPERVAAEPHPLLAVRPRLHRAAGDPDVLPRRPAARDRPDLPVDPRRRRARGSCREFDPTLTEPDWALGYRFDIVVGGRDATPEDPTMTERPR